MNCVLLSQEEKSELKQKLLEFVYRNLSKGNNKLPEEVAVLPAIVKLLLNGR